MESKYQDVMNALLVAGIFFIMVGIAAWLFGQMKEREEMEKSMDACQLADFRIEQAPTYAAETSSILHKALLIQEGKCPIKSAE